MKKWRCTVCGEIVESDVRPDKCPLCKAPGEKFVEVKEEAMTWAAEHVVGLGKAADVPEEIIEGLRANFQGECSELPGDRSVLGKGGIRGSRTRGKIRGAARRGRHSVHGKEPDDACGSGKRRNGRQI